MLTLWFKLDELKNSKTQKPDENRFTSQPRDQGQHLGQVQEEDERVPTSAPILHDGRPAARWPFRICVGDLTVHVGASGSQPFGISSRGKGERRVPLFPHDSKGEDPNVL